ncbi:MAG: class II aldolase/adducin family protein [Bacillota bacterium]
MKVLRKKLALAVRELYQAGLITSTGGNVSCRVDGGFLITPSGKAKGTLEAEDMIFLDAAGRATGGERPSAETGMHLAVYRERPDTGAVVHNHAPMSLLLGITGMAIPPVSLESLPFVSLPRVPFHLPGSRQLADAVGAALAGSAAVLLVNHGAVTAGSSLEKAVEVSHTLESAARMAWWLQVLKLPISELDLGVIEALLKSGLK